MTFSPLGREAPARRDETLLDVARSTAIPLGSSCGGVGICARCRVRIVAGAENLSPPTSVETRFGGTHGFALDERMACQAVVLGDCQVTTTYW